jgi:hypothetical protein
MNRSWLFVLMGLTLPGALSAQAQTQTVQCQPGDDGRPEGEPAGQPRAEYREYDVIVDVPDLCVERITLTVAGLDAHLSLNARVANLVLVQAGADVGIQTVELGIYGVRAQALLLVDLDNVVYIANRTLTFLDNSPEIVSGLMGTVNGALGTVGNIAGQALRPGGPVTQLLDAVGQSLDQVTRPDGVLSRVVNQAGQTVVRALDATGGIVELTADVEGQVLTSRALGDVLSITDVLSETTNTAGRTVRQVRDATGAVLEYTLDAAGAITNARVIQAAPRR